MQPRRRQTRPRLSNIHSLLHSASLTKGQRPLEFCMFWTDFHAPRIFKGFDYSNMGTSLSASNIMCISPHEQTPSFNRFSLGNLKNDGNFPSSSFLMSLQEAVWELSCKKITVCRCYRQDLENFSLWTGFPANLTWRNNNFLLYKIWFRSVSMEMGIGILKSMWLLELIQKSQGSPHREKVLYPSLHINAFCGANTKEGRRQRKPSSHYSAFILEPMDYFLGYSILLQ